MQAKTKQQPKKEEFDIYPSAVFLTAGSNYTRFVAMEDILDNSLDAHATHIQIDLFSLNDKLCLVVFDNGTGMDTQEIKDALAWGAPTKKREKGAKGKFGIGMKAASSSIGNRLVVVSQKEGSSIVSGRSLDFEKIKNTQSRDIDPITSFHEELWDLYNLYNKGTMILIEDIHDRDIKYQIPAFIKELECRIGTRFRYFISSSDNPVCFSVVNRKILNCSSIQDLQDGIDYEMPWRKVVAVDPMLKSYGSKLVLDHSEIVTIDGTKFPLIVKGYLLPEVNVPGLELNQKNQGLYFMRNLRQVYGPEKVVELWPGHNQNNRLRVEIFYNESGDDFIKVNFSKNECQLVLEIRQKLKDIILPYILRYRETSIIDKKESKLLDKFKNYLSAAFEEYKVKARKPGPGPGPGPKSPGIGPVTPPNPPGPPRVAKGIEVGINSKLSPEDPLWDATCTDKYLQLIFNPNHPFYQGLDQGKKLQEIQLYTWAAMISRTLYQTQSEDPSKFIELISSELRKVTGEVIKSKDE